MKKLAISLAITSALGLTACDDTSLEDVQAETKELRDQQLAESIEKQTTPHVRVVWDPANSNISIPNDLLMSGTIDGTLEMPAEVAAKVAGEAINFDNPEAALGALDGWGTQNAFTIGLEYDEGVDIDPTSILSGDSVALYQVEKYPSLTDSDCADSSMAGMVCKGLDKLTFGIDYVTTMSGGDIAIVPLKPLKGGASYTIALTKNIKDTNGNSLMPSSSYASVEQDINEFPIILPSIPDDELNATQAGFRLLQTITNNFEGTLARDFGANTDNIVYTQVFTVQSAGVPSADPIQVAKLLNAQEFATKAAADPASVAFGMKHLTVEDVMGLPSDAKLTVAQVLAAQGLIEDNPATAAYALFNAADLYGAELTLPYYLDDATGDPLTSRWKARCDSGATLSGMSDEQKAALAATAGDDQAFCSAFGLADLGVDTERHLTKYNPIPEVQSLQTVNVQITVPNIDNANVIRGMNGLPGIAARPDNGWPVVILQHGITSNKNDMLAATGMLSMFGFATVAIDHPLHGERGFVVGEGEEAKVINASSVVPGNDPTHYLNLQSLLTARDNLRQSVADTLQLRLALNAAVDMTDALAGLGLPDTGIMDSSRVYYLGHSLGAITGTNFTAIANSPVDTGDEATDAAVMASYKVSGSVLSNPGASIANFLVESQAFGDLIAASVTYGLGNELSEAIAANFDPTVMGQIIAANPACADALTDQNVALVCAFNAFKANASAEQLAGVAAGLSQFAFAAQAIIEAGDPTNYASLLKATDSPVLMYEMVGDLEMGGANPSDEVIPNTVSTNVLAGTTGLANQLGLSEITESVSDSSDSLSGVIRFTKGSHSTLLSPSTSLPEPYPTIYSAINQQMQMTAAYFFMSDGHSIQLLDDVLNICAIKNGGPEICSPSE
jgi:Pla-1/cef family extracellular lipase